MTTLKIDLWHGDCREQLDRLQSGSVDLILTDPPYELAFMGKGWDSTGIAFDPAVYEQIYRVLKPGGEAKVFSATRTFHRVCAVMEQAGFEGVKDNLEAWTYGSGFPKSLNIGKALDKIAGRALESTVRLKENLIEACDASGKTRAQIDEECGFRATNYLTLPKKDKRPDPWVHVLPSEEKWEKMKQVLGCGDTLDGYFHEAERQVVGTQTKARNVEQGVPLPGGGAETEYKTWDLTVASTELAKKWSGYGTALKPAWEPIVCGRKPA